MSSEHEKAPDERNRRFVEPRDDVESVRDDVARWIGVSFEEKARVSVELCRLVEQIIAVRPDRERVLREQEPPSADYVKTVRALRKRYSFGGAPAP